MDTAIASRRDGLESLDVRGFTAAYHHGGAGPPVIAAHCSSASHKALRPLIQQLEQRYEVFAPDLIGYGASDRWPADRPLEPETEVALITELAALAGAPVHLVGHSYGAMLSLEAARQLGTKVGSLTLIEPVSFHLLRPGGHEIPLAQITRVAGGVLQAMRAGQPKQAAAIYMGFWMGRWRWWLAPKRLKRGVLETIDKVAKEFALIERMEADLADYAAIRAPTRLIMGGRTRAPARAVIDILLETLPNVERRTIPQAGHMSPLSHPDRVNPLVLEHLAVCTGA
ncbi:alpha/beta fold hydrolase [Dichotomicrobium thermohalophilum]|uniref:Pimeloyl-ACP methyl ester carboxylesterase n=1 Tax=Dichotomicrobium thermohalophilum TaxID=933063 RepID=A0A397Q958_9HYPH|nr:alpha/beta hydrolase [Dichotomicrobium thermohalophilum]RIA56355.1 pimeloyl-ACP methyl ester carboxylesterase [Dichotomicrobium thermohalophilum]